MNLMQTADKLDQPAIVLVRPQMGENIGAVARAMHNFALTDLRIVQPRDGWPNPAAFSMASGADAVLENAGLYNSLDDAIADLHFTVALTARPRDMYKPAWSLSQAVENFLGYHKNKSRTGFLFGAERTGLENDEVCRAHAIVSFNVNPNFASLNLAQSVLLVANEYFQQSLANTVSNNAQIALEAEPASQQHMQHFFTHLEDLLEKTKFFFPDERRPHMQRSLRNLFLRAPLTVQDVQTLRGVLKSFERHMCFDNKTV